jgi:hypothetical protein
MTGVINTGAHPKAHWPGVKHFFGRAYDSWQPQWTDLVDVETSDKKYEEEVLSSGFGLATVKPEGDGITYDTDSQGYTARWMHVTYGTGFMVTEEELEDNLYPDLTRKRAPELADALNQTKEYVVANRIANRAFSSSYPIGDSKALCASDHPSKVGSQSNLLANGADISEAAVEDLVNQIRGAVNDRGMKKKIMPRSLHVSLADDFEAHRIYDSVLQSNSAENNVNVIRTMKVFPEGIKANVYFTSDSNWFIKTNVRNGNKLYQRRAMRIQQDNDFDTANAKTKATERYSVNTGDWRGWYGAQGV